jgi:DNA processing protein
MKIEIEKLKMEGNRSLLQNKDFHYLGIVGSRSILNYTENVLEDLFENYLIGNPFCIVSGGMYGVDLFSHNLSQKFGLKTIVVLPGGIRNYKNSHLYSSLKIKNWDNLLILSQFDEDISPRKYTFLERNKMVVELSEVLLVAQSSVKSGSIYSGNYALNKNKKVVAVPFSLDKFQFLGNNNLINRGARIYENGNTVLSEFSIKVSSTDISEKIKHALSNKGKTVIEISEELEVDVKVVEKSVLNLILEGSIFYNGEKYFV